MISAAARIAQVVTVKTLPLSYGKRSSDVVSLQKRLIKLGYKISSATGYYGSQTRASVIVFQKSKKLKQTGIVDKATLNAINTSLSAKTALPAKTQVSIVYVENHKQSSTLGNDITISEYSLSKNYISEINIYIYGKNVGKAAYGTNRSDVSKKYPSYPNSLKSGFRCTSNSRGYKDDIRTTKVEAMDRKNIYSTTRIHSHCNYMSPNGFEKTYKKVQKASVPIAS